MVYRGPEPGELRAFAALAALVFGAAAYGVVAHAELSPLSQPVVARIAPHVKIAQQMPARSRWTPDTLHGDTLFWLSRTFAPGDSRLVDVAGAGDVMMGARDIGLDPELRPETDASELVGKDISAIFHRADIAFANLEGALYDGDGPQAKDCEHCYSFRSPTFYARYLAQLGIGAVSLANNHSGDYGDEGRDSTLAALRANKIGFFGLDRDDARVAEFTLANGARAALVSFAPNTGTLDINDPDAEARTVRELKATHAIVVVSFHGGGEGEDFLHVSDARESFHGEDRGNVVAFAHTAIDAGADIVIGQGPHVPRALEIWHGHLIAYSLGNFWTYGAIDTSAIRGDGPLLEAWLAPDGTVAGFTIHSTEQRDSNVPHTDASREAEREILSLTHDDFPQTAAVLEAAREGEMARSDTTKGAGS
jgi:hypothetical protein